MRLKIVIKSDDGVAGSLVRSRVLVGLGVIVRFDKLVGEVANLAEKKGLRLFEKLSF